ncbi:MAG: hypothetical protein L0Y39_08495 [Methylococcaceae bacterium]|nr:hypothetical protein [Methylococcaceae bacterium]
MQASKQHRHYTAEEKVEMIRKHRLDSGAVSDLCEENQLNLAFFIDSFGSFGFDFGIHPLPERFLVIGVDRAGLPGAGLAVPYICKAALRKAHANRSHDHHGTADEMGSIILKKNTEILDLEGYR